MCALEPLSLDNLTAVLERALADEDRGLRGAQVEVGLEALGAIAQLASGDARRALLGLPLATKSCYRYGAPLVETYFNDPTS